MRGEVYETWLWDADHEVFTTVDDPETEERGVEDTLSEILTQQHPRPLKAQGEALYWYVQERHGDTQSKDCPGQDENTRNDPYFL